MALVPNISKNVNVKKLWINLNLQKFQKKYAIASDRTLSSLMNLFWDFYEARCGSGDAKNHGNVIHPPIINKEQDENTSVIIIQNYT